MSEIERVGVVGCGLMGSGIAQVAAQAGYRTFVREVDQGVLDRGLASIESGLNRAVKKERIAASERDAILDRIRGTVDLAPLGECDIVIEAIVEEMGPKEELFGALDDLCKATTLFASNTSSLSITELAATTERPDRVVGLHFFNPVPVMKLVEVVKTVTTSADTFTRTFAFARALGKEPIAAKDTSGFVVNLLLIPFLLDAISALERGVASVEDIDKGMSLGTGHPMGPFALLDFVGLDTTYRIAEIMFDEYRDRRYAPPPLLKRMVLAGMYGRKSGRGFYDYSVDPAQVSELGL